MKFPRRKHRCSFPSIRAVGDVFRCVECNTAWAFVRSYTYFESKGSFYWMRIE